MNSKKLFASALLSFLLSQTLAAQEHDHHSHAGSGATHQDHLTHSDHADHHNDEGDAGADTSNSTHPVMTHTDAISDALAEGGEPIVADVLGVVCDFCALAMNKIFGQREEIAAVYVDLDTKALNLVLIPGATLSDETIAELAVQAGYRVAAVRRGEQALGSAT
ncbi:hypothetical protein N9V98_02360 [Luminiphilus sp.]|jgi:hypothetical protein|nr:hypothetical protein [Luminiphilus sp.]MDB2364691.1 hypothetical protein [Luminiphilus sp.]MDB2688922.1 hypothetical protein [Luminiphilus sp.]